jgi:hypothetical protein
MCLTPLTPGYHRYVRVKVTPRKEPMRYIIPVTIIGSVVAVAATDSWLLLAGAVVGHTYATHLRRA